MRKKFKAILVITVLGLATVLLYLIPMPMAKKIEYGLVFSQKHSQNMGLDWRANYLALLDDLKVKNLKLSAHWDLLEPQAGIYDYSGMDWQIEQARLRDAKVMLVIGMKTPRWPECHIPGWAKDIGKEEQQKKILEMLENVVRHYKDDPAVAAWQVENEPLFAFGECPWTDKDFLVKEVALVRSLDGQNRPVVISDSGEGSSWFAAAKIGDIVGVTMYRRVYFKEFKSYVTYPIPPLFYGLKAKLIDLVFKKHVICVELQAEPWCANQLYDCNGAESEKTLSLEQFRNNIEYAKKTGFDAFYLWGAEWWYQAKILNNDPSFWEEAKKIFSGKF
ncbi:MAG: beta-galactosidase [Candidatus Pacebacteria bacterium]|nr:beta-galactosidase [Candidatus Paceibacterota bacterium]